MDLVNIVYRYVNRFMNSQELVKLLEEIDKTKFSKKEANEIANLLEEVRKVINTIPIEMDQVEMKRLASLNKILKDLEKIKTNKKNSEEARKFAEDRYNSLIKDKDATRDSGPRYEKLYELLVNNSVYLKYYKKMNDMELLKFITQYIFVPVPPNINQAIFNRLITVGIKEDKREALWRLAFNYNGKNKDFSRIEDYFIEKRDDYYLTEFLSAVKEDLDVDKLVEKVINTKDKSFIINCGNRAKDIGIFTEEEFEKIKEKLKNK